jgi:nitronate monooxygenase
MAPKPFRQLLRSLRVPVIQAPMAGGYNNPDLAEAVIRAGGIASFGFAYSAPDKIKASLTATRKKCPTGPLNANFFMFAEPEHAPTTDELEAAKQALREMSGCSDLELQSPQPPYFMDLESQLEPVWEADSNVDIVSFHFGIPPFKVIEKAKSLGKYVGVTATCLDEAKEIIAAGADYIVVQGVEAGGHRGVFTSNLRNQQKYGVKDDCFTTHELLCQIKIMQSPLSPENRIPLVAAGGIMTPDEVINYVGKAKENDRDEAGGYGADAVQLGTAFLTMQECATPALFRKALLTNDKLRQAVLTTAFSGRLANALTNTFTESMKGRFVLPHPLQNTLTGPIRQRAQQRGDVEFQSLFCGTNFSKCVDTNVERFMNSIFEAYAK